MRQLGRGVPDLVEATGQSLSHHVTTGTHGRACEGRFGQGAESLAFGEQEMQNSASDVKGVDAGA